LADCPKKLRPFCLFVFSPGFEPPAGVCAAGPPYYIGFREIYPHFLQEISRWERGASRAGLPFHRAKAGEKPQKFQLTFRRKEA